MRTIKAAAFFCLAPLALWAKGSSVTVADSMLMGVGAPAVGMGQAYTAVADDATALYWNPASLALVDKWAVSLDHSAFVGSSALDHAAAVSTLGPLGAIGVGGRYFSVGPIDRLDAAGASQGSYSPYDMSASVGYALRLGPASVGVSGKTIKSKVNSTAKTKALDAGAQIPFGGLRVAAVVANMGKAFKYGTTSEELPKIVRAGASLKFLENAWLVSAEGGFPSKGDAYVAAGMEYSKMVWRPDGGGTLVSLRLGYNTINKDVGGLAGPSLGLGFLLSNHMAFDYAFLPLGDLGITHHVSFSYKL